MRSAGGEVRNTLALLLNYPTLSDSAVCSSSRTARVSSRTAMVVVSAVCLNFLTVCFNSLSLTTYSCTALVLVCSNCLTATSALVLVCSNCLTATSSEMLARFVLLLHSAVCSSSLTATYNSEVCLNALASLVLFANSMTASVCSNYQAAFLVLLIAPCANVSGCFSYVSTAVRTLLLCVFLRCLWRLLREHTSIIHRGPALFVRYLLGQVPSLAR